MLYITTARTLLDITQTHRVLVYNANPQGDNMNKACKRVYAVCAFVSNSKTHGKKGSQ